MTTVHFCINPKCTKHLQPEPGGARCKSCGERALTLDDALTLTMTLAKVLKIDGATRFNGVVGRMSEKVEKKAKE